MNNDKCYYNPSWLTEIYIINDYDNSLLYNQAIRDGKHTGVTVQFCKKDIILVRKLFLSLFEKCINTNILVYINNFGYEMDIVFQEFITSTDVYHNITIVHEYNQEMFFKPNMMKNVQFISKKIANVLRTCNSRYYNEKTKNNIRLNYKNEYMDYFPLRSFGDNYFIQEIIFKENFMKNYKWLYDYYTMVPGCARNRILQFSGTCWLNAVLNSLFLTPTIALLLKENMHVDIEPELSRLINTFFIKKNN